MTLNTPGSDCSDSQEAGIRQDLSSHFFATDEVTKEQEQQKKEARAAARALSNQRDSGTANAISPSTLGFCASTVFLLKINRGLLSLTR